MGFFSGLWEGVKRQAANVANWGQKVITWVRESPKQALVAAVITCLSGLTLPFLGYYVLAALGGGLVVRILSPVIGLGISALLGGYLANVQSGAHESKKREEKYAREIKDAQADMTTMTEKMHAQLKSNAVLNETVAEQQKTINQQQKKLHKKNGKRMQEEQVHQPKEKSEEARYETSAEALSYASKFSRSEVKRRRPAEDKVETDTISLK